MKVYQTLEFTTIINMLCELALSEGAQEQAKTLKPLSSEAECRAKMRETTQAVSIMESFGTPPLVSMTGLCGVLESAKKGSMLIPEELVRVAGFINSCKRMRTYLKKAELINDGIAAYGNALCDVSELFEEIDRSIRNDAVDSNASTALRDIRRKIENAKSAVSAKLDSILRGSGKREWFSDSTVVTRGGRLCLPVKKEYKNQVGGTVIDTSSTGSTCFIEPAAVKKLQEEVNELQIAEDNEIRKILYTLTALVSEQEQELNRNRECMEVLDFCFAKGKLSMKLHAIPVQITADREIVIKEGRHPLLNGESCVPLDFTIGGDVLGIVITGPNTGGKTVSLKAVGLLSLMAQSGLHVPVGEGSRFGMQKNVLCDIGDGQSISENLSTFSSHIKNIISILQQATDESLVLLDELGSGTDPAEGMGLAVSILEELRQKGCLFVATTHYPEVKEYAANAPGLMNARMEFDRESLRPLYRLQIGEAGESCALYIAKRLGLPAHLLDRARQQAYSPETPFKFEPKGMRSESSPRPRPKKAEPSEESRQVITAFTMGDSVMVLPGKDIGIVYRPANEMGELIVQIKGEKQKLNHKRVKLVTPASELYPSDYDFSIVFDSVQNRKARRVMDKRHDPNVSITYSREE